MLILQRTEGESIVIGDSVIVITVVQVRGDKVRLGISAPDDMTVHRSEVYEQIRREGRDPADRASLRKGGG